MLMYLRADLADWPGQQNPASLGVQTRYTASGTPEQLAKAGRSQDREQSSRGEFASDTTACIR